MKKLALCAILLLLSVPLSAGILGLEAGITGGVENWKLDAEGEENQSLKAIGLTASFSPPIIPVGIRGDIEYAWKDVETPAGGIKLSDIFILIAVQYSISPPLVPLSLYLGGGYEISTIGTDYGEYLGADGSITDSGFLVYGGLNLSLGLFAVFAETGYGMIFADDANYTHIPIRGGIKISI
ncbi:hypothetical protein JW879_08830 [candidate division WOR-3 bacterium]|nr:hypothetical protein [candidate division WOR-3 bacterium]